jgi:hypothetical protein
MQLSFGSLKLVQVLKGVWQVPKISCLANIPSPSKFENLKNHVFVEPICLAKYQVFFFFQPSYFLSFLIISLNHFSHYLSAFSKLQPKPHNFFTFSSFKSPHLTSLLLHFIGTQVPTLKRVIFPHSSALLWKSRTGMNLLCNCYFNFESLCFLFYL